MPLFLAEAENVTINSSLVITVLVIIALVLAVFWLWRHK